MITLNKEFNGKILDIGGGGEGVIGRLYTNQVVAIDIRQDELDEAPSGFEKILMDATHLKFSDNSFDHVTSFYSLMFMSSEDQKSAISEAARVLVNGGELHIWDCNIPSAYPEPFCVDVTVCLPNEHISTTYGVVKKDTQNALSITNLCLKAGLVLACQNRSQNSFYLRLKKADKFQFVGEKK